MKRRALRWKELELLLLRSVLLVGIFVVGVPALALADSDGYYCVGRNYIAYQFGMGAPPVAPHILYVIRFDENGRMSKTIRYRLPQFQVHGLRCRDDAIDIAAYDAIHTVSLVPGQPMQRTMAPRLEWPEWTRGMSLNLGMMARLGTHERELFVSPAGHRFVLRVVSVKSEKPCMTDTTSDIIGSDPAGNVIHSRPVFRGHGSIECGE